MLDDVTIELMSHMLWITLLLLAPSVGAALVIGLIIGLVQAITSIQEQTLSFVPKVVAVAVVFIFTGAWMGKLIVAYTIELFVRMPEYGSL
jgi:flagellar biosynthesis protein FliQ